MLRKIIVELVSDVAKLMQPGPGHGGEIVVLVVEADVVCEDVGRAVVRECLGDGEGVVRIALFGGDGFVDVVLGDEVGGERVEGAG